MWRIVLAGIFLVAPVWGEQYTISTFAGVGTGTAEARDEAPATRCRDPRLLLYHAVLTSRPWPTFDQKPGLLAECRMDQPALDP